MLDYLKLNLTKKSSLDKVSATDFNSIVEYLSSITSILNIYQKDICNLTLENDGKIYSLSTAMDAVPTERRSCGMIIKFQDSDGSWEQWIYSSRLLTRSAWVSQSNWKQINTASPDTIDGGVITED